MTEEEALAAMDAASDGDCPMCGKPDGQHCDQCWRCPGDRHDDMCGW